MVRSCRKERIEKAHHCGARLDGNQTEFGKQRYGLNIPPLGKAVGPLRWENVMGEKFVRQRDVGMCPQEQPQQTGTVTDRLISMAYQVHYGQ